MEPLKIKQKIEDMITYAYIVLAQFPKSEKHTLAAEIKRSMFRLLELVIACNKKVLQEDYHARTRRGTGCSEKLRAVGG